MPAELWSCKLNWQPDCEALSAQRTKRLSLGLARSSHLHISQVQDYCITSSMQASGVVDGVSSSVRAGPGQRINRYFRRAAFEPVVGQVLKIEAR